MYRNIVVAICNPSLMSAFRSFYESIELSYSILKSPESLPDSGVLVVDDECLRLIKGSVLPKKPEIVRPQRLKL